MRQGIIMEIEDHFITVLTPEGEFLRTTKQKNDVEIGQEIEFTPEVFHRTLIHGMKRKKKWNIALGSLLVASVLLAFITFPTNHQTVYAYMSIDVNPSVELALNKELEVLQIKSYNDEGKVIINSLTNWRGSPAADVTDRIFAEFEDEGYLQQGTEVVIGTVYTKKAKEQKELNHVIESVTNKYQTESETVTATESQREVAVENGESVGTYVSKQMKKEEMKKENKKKENKNKKENVDENQPQPEAPTPQPIVPETDQPVPTPAVEKQKKNVKEERPIEPQPKTSDHLDESIKKSKEKEPAPKEHPIKKEEKLKEKENKQEKPGK